MSGLSVASLLEGSESWRGILRPPSVDAWRQAHCAVQPVAEVGKRWAPWRADDSHSAQSWDEGLGALAGVSVGRDEGRVRAGLRPEGLELVFADEAGDVLESLELRGRTLSSGMAWATERAGVLTGEGPAREPEPIPDHPEHPVWDGAEFDAGDGELALLAACYEGASRLLSRVRDSLAEASVVTCWPHHFDVATLVTMERDARGEARRTIGLGLAMPDGLVGEGYFYVAPWPGVRAEGLARLAAGRWRLEGRVMALLGLEEVCAAGGARSQAGLISTFLADAFGACAGAEPAA